MDKVKVQLNVTTKWLLLLFLLTTFTACNNKKRIEVKNKEGIVVESYFVDKKHQDIKVGVYHKFYDDGKLLEEAYDGPRHFDAHAYRSEDEEGVWDFAAGCMRTYLILKEKAQQFNDDPDIQSLLAEIKATDPNFEPVPVKFTPERAKQIKEMNLDRVALSRKRLPYEKLDQLVVDLLLGIR